MTKELPYFKFFPGKWLTGDITLQEQNLQGIFINVCAIYWSKKCNLNMDRLKQRYGVAIDTLLSLGLVKSEGSKVLINFLDEQWIELNGSHVKNVENGKIGAEKRWNKNSPPIAFREEKIRKDKRLSKITFNDSAIFDKVKFKEKFSEWNKQKLGYYWNSALAYSGEGHKYIDWASAIRNWAKRDELQGKLKFNTSSNSTVISGII